MGRRDDQLGPDLDSSLGGELGDPEFAADSISLPVDVDSPRRSSPAPASSKAPLIVVLSVVVIALGVIAAALLRSGRAPEVTAIPVEPTPSPAAAPIPPPTPPPAAADPPPPPAPVAAKAKAKAKATGTRKPRQGRARRRDLDAKFESALKKLDDLDDRPSPDPAEPGTEGEGAEGERPPVAAVSLGAGAPATDDSPASAELACANGDGLACVRAGAAAERGTDSSGGARARQLYGVACMNRVGEGCWRLARLLKGGIGGAQDPVRARVLEQKACKLGHRKSCDAAAKTATTSR